MVNTFFQMRDELMSRLGEPSEGGTPSNSTCVHVFRVLMEHGIYSKDGNHGYVIGRACRQKFIARATQLNIRSVQRALNDLEEAGWIAREDGDIVLCWATGGQVSK